MEDKRNFAFDKTNFILLAAGMIVIIAGLILMAGSGSTESAFNADIFSAQRIKVAPIVCFAGFIFVIYAVIRKPKTTEAEAKETVEAEVTEEAK